jgi:hypothetical protein
MMEKKKTHRNILEIERNFLINVDGPVAGLAIVRNVRHIVLVLVCLFVVCSCL